MLGEVTQLSRGCTAGECLSWDSNPGLLSIKPELSLLCYGQSLNLLTLPFSLDPLKGEPRVVMDKGRTLCFGISCLSPAWGSIQDVFLAPKPGLSVSA